MTPTIKRPLALAASLAPLFAIACGAPGADTASLGSQEAPSVVSENGLNSLNGLNSFNGLSSANGLDDGIDLMTTPAGRNTFSYIVRCALPSNRTITKKDKYGRPYSFTGEIGMASQWEAGSCDQTCQEQISACLLAHVNTTGQHVALWLDSDSSAVGWGQSTAYPYQEGSFFGNVFHTPPTAYYCNGKDFDQGVVPGRLGANQAGAPYVNPFAAQGGYCASSCTAADYPYNKDGYKACAGYTHVVTVWRNFDPNTNYKVCSRNSGKCLDVWNASTADGAQLVQYSLNGGNNQKWRITQVSPGHYTFRNVRSNKFLDISGASTGNGVPLIQWPATGSANQQWSFTPTGDGYFKFSPGSQPAASLDVKNGSTADGTTVVQWAWSGASWQQWSILPVN